MRIAASCITGSNRHRVEAVARAGAPRGRISAPAQAPAPETASRAPGTFEVAPAVPVRRAAVVAQSVYHIAFGGPAEESLVRANGAYRRADEMRFRTEPYFREVA